LPAYRDRTGDLLREVELLQPLLLARKLRPPVCHAGKALKNMSSGIDGRARWSGSGPVSIIIRLDLTLTGLSMLW
jgi:hypothetical protein